MTDTAIRTTQTTWAIDANHSTLEFSVKHMMFTTVKGRFEDFTGKILFDSAHVENSRVDVTIHTGSLNTNTAARDNHLRSAEFFDTANYPLATLRSTSVEGDSDNFVVKGDLTIKGITHPITLKAEYQGSGVNPSGIMVAGFEAKGTFNRKDFGLAWNQALESGGVLIGEEVKFSLEVQAAEAGS
ncbi:MAG: YceI family protein [Thermomicrobiales bacterium]